MRRSRKVDEQPLKAIVTCIECKVSEAKHWDNKLCEVCLTIMLSESNIKNEIKKVEQK